MTILDTEPLDGVDNKNGILGYITFVSSPHNRRETKANKKGKIKRKEKNRWDLEKLTTNTKQVVDPTKVRDGSTANASKWQHIFYKLDFLVEVI